MKTLMYKSTDKQFIKIIPFLILPLRVSWSRPLEKYSLLLDPVLNKATYWRKTQHGKETRKFDLPLCPPSSPGDITCLVLAGRSQPTEKILTTSFRSDPFRSDPGFANGGPSDTCHFGIHGRVDGRSVTKTKLSHTWVTVKVKFLFRNTVNRTLP